ncbi:MAG TPA: ABC transporter permease [bacterium]|nr:ABC transporter permease [bacterium]
MSRYILRRLVLAAATVFAVVTVVFSLLHLLPGDPVLLILGQSTYPDPEAIRAVRTALGLDRPLLVQYGDFLRRLASLDAGRSLYDHLPVGPDLALRFPRTLELIGAATLLAVAAGIPAGIYAANHRNRLQDWIISAVAALGISSPVYVIGTLLMLVFVLWAHWFPSYGYVPFTARPLEHLRSLTLPAVTLAFGIGAVVVRITRSSFLDALGQDSTRTARAKGLQERLVLFRHVLRCALVPVITVVGLQVGNLLGGTVLVEYIYSYPGLSTFLVQAISRRDYPAVQAVLLLISVAFVCLNLLVDLLYAAVDPRVRYQ